MLRRCSFTVYLFDFFHYLLSELCLLWTFVNGVALPKTCLVIYYTYQHTHVSRKKIIAPKLLKSAVIFFFVLGLAYENIYTQLFTQNVTVGIHYHTSLEYYGTSSAKLDGNRYITSNSRYSVSCWKINLAEKYLQIPLPYTCSILCSSVCHILLSTILTLLI